GGESGGVGGGTEEGVKGERGAVARRSARHLRTGGGRAFLRNGVPFAASVASALPTAVGGAAVLADEAGFATGHGRNRCESPGPDVRPHTTTRRDRCDDSAARDWSAPRSRWCPCRRQDHRCSHPRRSGWR